MIGSGESREAFQIREFLSRNQVPFTWIDVIDDVRTADLLRDFGIDEKDLPVVAAGNSPFIRNPSIRELAESLGIWRAPRAETYDLVIVGGGPAGLAAAVYAASEGLSRWSSKPDRQAGRPALRRRSRIISGSRLESQARNSSAAPQYRHTSSASS